MEIIKELITYRKTNEITSDKVLSWTEMVEAQRAQKAILDTLKESKEFYMIKRCKAKLG